MKNKDKQEILEAINGFAQGVQDQFDSVKDQFDEIKAQMVTKSYLDDKMALEYIPTPFCFFKHHSTFLP